jgi:hypothetical protein
VDFAGIVIGHDVMIIVIAVMMTGSAYERAVGHVASTHCIVVAFIPHIIVNQAAVGWLRNKGTIPQAVLFFRV